MRFSLRSLMGLTAIIAIQLAIPQQRIPIALFICSGAIFTLFAMSIFACVFGPEVDGQISVTNNRRLSFLLRVLALALICFWALFFNSMIRGMLS